MLIETLTAEEARVLGALIEKSLATPDYYPLTLNSLRTACNQKSNREPVTDYDDGIVSLALSGLKRKCLVTFIPYGSSGNQHKYRHFLEDVRFNLRKPDLAVLAALLLRGGQTLNEIRLRATSMHPLASLEETEAVLTGLAGRAEPMAELLAKRPGWKEPRWRDRLREHGEEPVPQSGAALQSDVAPKSGGYAEPSPAPAEREDELEALRREVAELRIQFAEMKAIVDRIRSELF